MERRHVYIITVVQMIGVCGLIWFLVRWKGPWNLERYVGMVLVLSGLAFIGLARYQLGRSFSVQAEAHALVTTGIYSKIRNPIYIFDVVMLSGIILVIQKPVGWIFVMAVIVAQTIRARREARVLEAAFGEAYREYRRKTWF